MNRQKTDIMHMVSVATSPFHCIEESRRQLEAEGYLALTLNQTWNLEEGKGYFVDVYGSSFIAFRVNPGFKLGDSYRMSLAHTDFPGFRIKSNPDVVEGTYRKLNTEVYGGPIIATWLDRPLSISGRVVVKGESIFTPEFRLVDFKRPLLTIPNLAPHLERSINSGKEYNRQTELLPIIGVVNDLNKENGFMKLLAAELGVEEDQILDFELGLYCYEEPCYMGMEEEFISAPRLDNLTSVQACITGLVQGGRTGGIDLIACFDHEEIGSRTKNGGASNILGMITEKIYEALGGTPGEYRDALLSSHSLSVDVAHALHPNRKEKSDITNFVTLNGGIAIKTANSHSYAIDGEMVGILKGLCEHANMPYQQYFNRSDIPGGSTLGAIVNALLPIPTQDIGVPLIAMHSARELMGRKDQEYLEQLLTNYYTV